MKQYKLLQADTTEELHSRVDLALSIDWQLYGEPIVVVVGLGTRFYQAVIK